MTFFKKKHLLRFVFAILICVLPLSASAQYERPGEGEITWERHESVTGIFAAKFPEKHRYKVFPFRFNENTVAFSTEIVSSLDGKESTNDKSILIRTSQTFGDELTRKEIDKILDREARKFEQTAAALGGVVLANESITHKNFPGRRLYITYKDKGEKYGIRVRVYLTNYSKIEQVLSGPAQSMYSYRSDDFFDSIKLYDGINQLKDNAEFSNGWETHTSKNNIFTVKLPPQNIDYTPLPVSFKASPKKEVMRFEFVDPVRSENVFYYVYSYKLNKPISYEKAKNILFSSHVNKYVKNASIDSFDTESFKQGNTKVMTAKLVISPPKKTPYVSTLYLEGRYKDDIITVQEIVASAGHARSGMTKLLAQNLKFHPEKYTPVKIPAKKKEEEKKEEKN